METPRQVTVLQAAIILSSSIIGVGVLALSLIAVRSIDSGAPLVTLLGGLLAGAGVVILILLGMRFPSRSIVLYSEEIIGKWPARAGSLMLILFFALLTALAAREFGEVVVTSVLPRTPLEVTVIAMLLLAALSSRNDMSTFAYIHYFYFPWILLPGIFIVIFSLKNAEPLHLLPIWGNQPKGMLTGVLTLAALFQGSFVITIVIPAMRRPERALRAGLAGMGIATGLYVLIVLATVAVFGSEEILNLVWPTLELARTTSLPANVLERLDAAFLAVWVTAVFTSLYATYYFMALSLRELLRFRDHKIFTFLLLPFIFILAMLPQNLMQMYHIIQIVGRLGLLVTIVYLLLLLVVALIRNKKEGART